MVALSFMGLEAYSILLAHCTKNTIMYKILGYKSKYLIIIKISELQIL
jgi:hypothetical protein